MMKPNTYKKRSLTFHLLNHELKKLITRRKYIKQAMKHSLNPAFIEHIMLACTAVNECRYCAWGHALVTTKLGEDTNTIINILKKDLNTIPKYERPALEFAIHYAETQGNYDPKEYQQLKAIYHEKAQDILTVIMMINFGNLLGNTVDAFESRIHKQPPEHGNPLLEFLIYALGGYAFKKIMEHHPLYKTLEKQQAIKPTHNYLRQKHYH